MSAMVQAFAAAFIAAFGAGIAFFFGVDGLRKRRAPRGAATPADPAVDHGPGRGLGTRRPRRAGDLGGARRRPRADDLGARRPAGIGPRTSFASELIEVGVAGSPQASGFDSWGNPRSMFSKPMRANGSEPGHTEHEGSSVATVDPDDDRDRDHDHDPA